MVLPLKRHLQTVGLKEPSCGTICSLRLPVFGSRFPTESVQRYVGMTETTMEPPAASILSLFDCSSFSLETREQPLNLELFKGLSAFSGGLRRTRRGRSRRPSSSAPWAACRWRKAGSFGRDPVAQKIPPPPHLPGFLFKIERTSICGCLGP